MCRSNDALIHESH
jgi:hypothetical protein